LDVPKRGVEAIKSCHATICDHVRPEQLPCILRKLSEVIGIKAALSISGDLGGEKIYVAKWSPDADKQGKDVSRLIECIGNNAAQRVCDLFGGSHIIIPSCKDLTREARNKAIRTDAHCKIKRGEMARKYGLSVRQIRRVISDTSG